MLKPPGPPPPSEPQRSIGELIEQVLDDALDYGRAEVDLLKARASDVFENYARVAVFFGVALVFALAGLVTLFVGIAFALARWIGPLGGAVVSTLLAATIAALLAWFAMRELKEEE